MPKLRLIFAFLLTAAAATFCRAQTAVLPEKLGEWQKGSCTAGNLPELAVEAAGRSFTSCPYTKDSKVVTITLGQYKDPTAAYEIYTSRITTDMSASTLGARMANTAIDSKRLVAQIGDYVAEVSSPRIISGEDLQELIRTIYKQADKTMLPPIRTFLPEVGMVDGSQRFAPGPESFRLALDSLKASDFAFLGRDLGFDQGLGLETMLAQYHYKNDFGVVLLAKYPTQQIAGNHLHHLDEVLDAAGKKDSVKIQQRGSLLFMVLNSSSTKFADALRNDVRYGTSVTWNEGVHTITDPPITSSVVKIIMATGAFMLVAIVLGIAFGGVRIITKRLFPGKVFDRPQDIEVLQMGLSGKKIDPTDFY